MNEEALRAIAELDRDLPGSAWLLSQGRVRPEEPLYGFAIYHADADGVSRFLNDEVEAVSAAEADTAAEAIRKAIAIAKLKREGAR